MLTVVLIILMILAVVCLGIAAFRPAASGRWHFGWLGMFLWALVVAIGMLAGVDINVD